MFLQEDKSYFIRNNTVARYETYLYVFIRQNHKSKGYSADIKPALMFLDLIESDTFSTTGKW